MSDIVSYMMVVLVIVSLCCSQAIAAEEGVALLSDIEGSRRKFDDFLDRHQAFYRGEDGKRHLKPGAGFVFGGDVPDRFPGERYVLRELLRLKEESPDRVVLIAGNRDVNKLRIPGELSERAMKAGPAKNIDAYRAWLREKELSESRAARLRWMLEKTMGSPDAFELRRKEVGDETGRDAERVGDDEVVESYLQDSRPGGLFIQYLRHACLMHRDGDTLFVHAGLPQAALGHTPGKSSRDARPDAWQKTLNQWFQDQLTEWEERHDHWDDRSERPGSVLISYAEKHGQKSVNPFSVLYGRAVDEEGKVDLPAKPVIEWLKKHGVRRLVVGHTPSGHVPVVRRLDDGSFELLVLDTSYGDRERAPLVTLLGPKCSTTQIDGRLLLRTGESVAVRFQAELGQPGVIGSRLSDGGVVVAPHANGWISYRLLPGYKVRYDHHATPDIRSQEQTRE